MGEQAAKYHRYEGIVLSSSEESTAPKMFKRRGSGSEENEYLRIKVGKCSRGDVYCAEVLEVAFSKEKGGSSDLLHETVARGRVIILVPLLF